MAMGPAARRARRKRKKFLLNLSSSQPERFAKEWEKRIQSWLDWIKTHAGRSDPGSGAVYSVFAVVDESLALLESCGEGVYRKYAYTTSDILLNQCIASFRREVMPQIMKYKHTRFPELKSG